MSDEPVMVLTVEDAKTILWANAPDFELAGVAEWDDLVAKAEKVLALQKVLDRA
jgi:hypothetical protein